MPYTATVPKNIHSSPEGKNHLPFVSLGEYFFHPGPPGQTFLQSALMFHHHPEG